METATRNQWLAAIRDAQRDHDQRIRETLGQSLSQMKAKAGQALGQAGEFLEGRPAAIRANVPELRRQGVRTIASVGAAGAIGFARGYAGDERFNVRGMPIELLIGIGAHIVAGTVLAGTPAALVAHGVADGMIGVSAAHLARELGTRARAAIAARQPEASQTTAGYAPPYALPPGYEPHALAAYAGAPSNSADRAMAEAIEIMREHEQRTNEG
jgi:hypothetical protein